jgi:hypothetical protein
LNTAAFSPPVWRHEFFVALAEMTDELLPEPYESVLRNGATPGVSAIWDAHTILQPAPVDTPDALRWSEAVVRRVEERGLLSAVVEPQDLFALLLGRKLGENEPGAQGRSRERTLSAILRSAEFSRSMPWIAKATINRGRWNYFVHIPKTAGSHFQAMLWTQFGPGGVLRAYPDQDVGVSHPWVTAAWLRRLLYDDDPQTWVSGHLRLHEIRPAHAMWPTDRVVTLVRDPVDQAISAANYYFGLRESQPQAAQRYFRAILDRQDDLDLEGLDLSTVVSRVAAKDDRLRPSFYFANDLPNAVLGEPVVLGFQEHLVELLQFVSAPNQVILPEQVLQDQIRLNRSFSRLEATSLDADDLAKLVNASAPAVVDYYAMRRLARSRPYVAPCEAKPSTQ